MKATFAVLAASSLFLAGCGDSSSNPPKATNENSSVITAPVDYLGAVAKAQQASIKTIDIAQLTQAIQAFQVEQDRLPKDLDELVKMNYVREMPKAPYGKKIVYDANTGTVKVVVDPNVKPAQ
jgi:PBP1b-binding outer membrane lipoprotein LpoB